MKNTMTNTMKNLIGKKVTVKKGAGDFYENCNSRDAAYLIITKQFTHNFTWDAYDKDGEKIESCDGHGLTEDDFLPYNKTLDDVEWKDLLKDNVGDYHRVLSRHHDMVDLSYAWKEGEKENTAYYVSFSIQRLKDLCYTFAEEKTVDTIEINGKTYDKAQVDERLKELKPIE